MAIVILIIFILVIGGMFGLAIWKIRQTNPNNVDTSLNPAIDTTQGFLSFEDIKDGVIDLGNHQYRAVIKCSSINYDLKTEKEQDIVELSFQRFLNSLNNPISILVQTKEMDNSKMLKSLKDDIAKTVDDFPILAEYGELYYNSMENLCGEIGNSKTKNKYIIVPYNDAISLTNSTEEEKYEYALRELNNRCHIIKDGLQSVGIHTEILNTKELIELVYSSYNKDTASQAENITSGEFMKMIVSGEDKLSKVTDEGRLDWILYEAQIRLETELAGESSIDESIKERAISAINELNKIRDELAVYHKTDVNIDKKIKILNSDKK